MAKADLDSPNKVRKLAEWQREASICRRANALSQLTDKEIASALDMTPAQFCEQMAGRERPQGERYRASDRMRGFYLVAQAEAFPDLFDVVTTITIRRTA